MEYGGRNKVSNTLYIYIFLNVSVTDVYKEEKSNAKEDRFSSKKDGVGLDGLGWFLIDEDTLQKYNIESLRS